MTLQTVVATVLRPLIQRAVRWVCVTVLIVQLAIPVAAGPCVLSVEGEEPMSAVERDEPFRLASDPGTLPGYKGLLLRPLNRPSEPKFYEIIGRTYRGIPRPAPGSTFLDSEAHAALEGHTFLAGWDDRILWQLPAGSEQWQKAVSGERWWGTAYDEGSKDFYVGFGPQAPLLRWDGSTFVPAGAMPTAFGDATSSLTAQGLPVAIHTLPEAGGTFAVAVDWQNEDWRSLWFRPFGGEWALVANAPELDQLSPGSRFPGPFGDVYVSEDGRAVRILAGGPRQATIHLVRTPGGWRLDSTGPYEFWLRHDPSGVRLSWIGEGVQKLTERYLLLFEREIEPVAPKLYILDPGSLTPRPFSDIEPFAERTGDSVFYLPAIRKVPGIEALLIRAADGWYAFDGREMTAIPSLTVERVGALADIRQVGPLVLVQSEKGVFRLGKDLVAERVETFPDDEPYGSSVTVDYLTEVGLFIVVSDREAIYVSKDFVQFDEIDSPQLISGVVAQLPDRPGLLLVGSDGLYTLEAECPESNGP